MRYFGARLFHLILNTKNQEPEGVRKMKKIIVLLVFMLLNIGFVLGDQLIPVTFEVNIEFDEERDFRLIMPNGYERHFYWDNGTTHSDVTFDHTIYHEIDEEEWCSDNSELDEYKNISTHLASMLTTCEYMVDHINDSQELIEEKEALKTEMYGYQQDRDIYKEKWETKRNESADCKTELEDCEQKEEQYHTELMSCQGEIAGFDSCKDDLASCKSSGTTRIFIGIILGVVGTYFFTRNKVAKQSPSEQKEAGNVGDFTEASFKQTFTDGPKE
jgi:hypothetical protein